MLNSVRVCTHLTIFLPPSPFPHSRLFEYLLLMSLYPASSAPPITAPCFFVCVCVCAIVRVQAEAVVCSFFPPWKRRLLSSLIRPVRRAGASNNCMRKSDTETSTGSTAQSSPSNTTSTGACPAREPDSCAYLFIVNAEMDARSYDFLTVDDSTAWLTNVRSISTGSLACTFF